MRLKIGKIDHDGYNGRDFHPEARHEGQIVLAVGMETLWCSEDGSEWESLKDADPTDRRTTDRLADHYNHETMWTAYTEDGEKLQLMQHEILFDSGFDGWVKMQGGF